MGQTFEPTAEDCLAALDDAIGLDRRSRTGAKPRPSRTEVKLATAAAMALCRIYTANALQRIRFHRDV